MATEHWLFCYGTLCDGPVQRRVFGRLVEGVADTLEGFALGEIVIRGGTYNYLRPGGADRVAGVALRLTDDELARADAYEPADYVRIKVTLVSGRRAFVYVAADV
jgi:gamma-glutamyl AIG2-like cyclotransferase